MKYYIDKSFFDAILRNRSSHISYRSVARSIEPLGNLYANFISWLVIVDTEPRKSSDKRRMENWWTWTAHRVCKAIPRWTSYACCSPRKL